MGWMKAGGNSYLSAPLLTLGGNVKIEYGDTLDVSESSLVLADDQISGDKINAGTIDTITINDLNNTNTTIENDLNIENIYMSNKPGETDKKTGQFYMKAGKNSYISAPLLTFGGSVKIENGDSLDVSNSSFILADDQINGDKIN